MAQAHKRGGRFVISIEFLWGDRGSWRRFYGGFGKTFFSQELL